LAANVTLVPAEQKVAVSTTNTPTTAQLVTIPWKLPTRYRNNACGCCTRPARRRSPR
jgi:hypothetical protein